MQQQSYSDRYVPIQPQVQQQLQYMPPTEQVLGEIQNYPGEKVYFDLQDQEPRYNWSIENQTPE